MMTTQQQTERDEPAEPDRYVEVTREVGALLFSKGYLGGLYDNEENFQAAAAVLRKHFEPSAEVVEAARFVKDRMGFTNCAETLCADFILKGDV